jgi:LytS/YehU family sensor histidine kinase
VTRAFLFPLLGHGTYDYGILSVRYPMEAAQDFFSYATFVGVLTLIRVSTRLRAREVRGAELERDAANARLEALRLRLQPHFLFNALNTISSTVYQDPVTADELIGHLGELLRQSLRASDRPEIRLDEELELVRAYQALIEARFGDRVRFTFEIAADMDALAVPAFLLQPLIENAVEHGASLEYGRTDIRVAAARRADLLEIVVENDSDDEPVAPNRFGTGLGTTRDRLDLLYRGRASLETRAEAGQFRVVVRLPARQMESPPAPAPAPPRHARADR